MIAPLTERDLPEAERIFRFAFGTFLGARAGDILERSGLCPWPLAGTSRRRTRRNARWPAGRFQLCDKMGKRRILGPLTVRADLQEHGSARHCSPRQWTNLMPGGPGTPNSQLRAQREACGPVSEVRLPCALSYRDHVCARAAGAADNGLVALPRIERRSKGRGFACQRGHDGRALPGSRPIRRDSRCMRRISGTRCWCKVPMAWRRLRSVTMGRAARRGQALLRQVWCGSRHAVG